MCTIYNLNFFFLYRLSRIVFFVAGFLFCGLPILFFAGSAAAQSVYTKQDSLRGTITPERIWWDLLRYDLQITVIPDAQYISGENTIHYKVLKAHNVLQIDLQPPMSINWAVQGSDTLSFQKVGNAHFIRLAKVQKPGDTLAIRLGFSGKPLVAKNAPWDGGFSWAKDKAGNHFVATSCQGLGASAWWPCKDHMYDEPENGITLSANVPENLVAVANGRLLAEKKGANNTKTYIWRVVNPINNYGVNLNIGNYVNFSEKYEGEKGTLDMDYWVLAENLKKAKKQFKDGRRSIEAFEYWFGPYPFYEDSYKLVEVPYLGMEHQSSVTYGNGYENGYKGRDLSNTGWGLKWDFIIVHETGHEWFANSITNKDIADMWIHESFTKYAETLFVEYFYGKEAARAYTKGHRLDISNDKPIIGDYDVNAKGSHDMYNKGSNMLHTLRQIVGNDSSWRNMLRKMNRTFYHQTVSSKQIENFMSNTLSLTLDKFFDQYLRTTKIPVFEYRIIDNALHYRWANCVEGFDMPLDIFVGKEKIRLTPTPVVQVAKLKQKKKAIRICPEFYVYSLNAMGK